MENALQKQDCLEVLYNAACTYSLAAASVQLDEELNSQQRKQLEAMYTHRAMQLLQHAEKVGWFEGGSAVESLSRDHDFDILRNREDFQQLLQKVKTRLVRSQQVSDAV